MNICGAHEPQEEPTLSTSATLQGSCSSSCCEPVKCLVNGSLPRRKQHSVRCVLPVDCCDRSLARFPALVFTDEHFLISSFCFPLCYDVEVAQLTTASVGFLSCFFAICFIALKTLDYELEAVQKMQYPTSIPEEDYRKS